jgi:hypothetical protein
MHFFDDWINQPFVRTLLGMAIGALLVWFANRKLISLQGEAARELASTYLRQNEALTSERNEYREKLHDERDRHQAAELRIKELEARPDLSSLTVLLKDNQNWMRDLGDQLRSHSESDAKLFGQISESLSTALKEYPKALEKMSDRFDERQKAAMDAIRKAGSGD